MRIVGVRIDEIMINGGVTAGWLSALKAKRIMLINTSAAQNKIQILGYRMACPDPIFLSVLSEAKALDRFENNAYGKEKTLVVLKNFESVLKMEELGYHFDKITVGMIANKFGAERLNRDICLTESERAAAFACKEKGIQLVFQPSMSEPEIDFFQIFEESVQA